MKGIISRSIGVFGIHIICLSIFVSSLYYARIEVCTWGSAFLLFSDRLKRKKTDTTNNDLNSADHCCRQSIVRSVVGDSAFRADYYDVTVIHYQSNFSSLAVRISISRAKSCETKRNVVELRGKWTEKTSRMVIMIQSRRARWHMVRRQQWRRGGCRQTLTWTILTWHVCKRKANAMHGAMFNDDHRSRSTGISSTTIIHNNTFIHLIRVLVFSFFNVLNVLSGVDDIVVPASE